VNVCGLFSGIGGLELPFHLRGAKTSLLCECWAPAVSVLTVRFPDAPIHHDVAQLAELPEGTDVVTAGFPCTDLSQAGRTAGIDGKQSGLVSHVFRLLANENVKWLILENVRNMLVLERGRAMHYLTQQLESLGFSWAYRVVDSQFTGVPQRRHRVLLVASREGDPRSILFADEAGPPHESEFGEDAFGFYWTEGYTGLGWARDAVPPLKGGSTVGIPSPPAVWRPHAPQGLKIVTPSIEDAERFQGFESGWTKPADDGRANGPRWKLVGNAVTVGVSDWLVGRLYKPGAVSIQSRALEVGIKWPDAAFGFRGRVWSFDASHWPVAKPRQSLTQMMTEATAKPLSARATQGFLDRVRRSKLRFEARFLDDLREHLAFMRSEDRAPELVGLELAS
jgi:DNA (cytosine-5)-methyltransferase 1